MYNHKAQQNKNRVHISWDILYVNLLWQFKCVGLVDIIKNFFKTKSNEFEKNLDFNKFD